MALIFFKGVTGADKEEVWYNMASNTIMQNPPSLSEKIMDIIISHAKYDYDLSEIILALRQIENNGLALGDVSVSPKNVEKHMNDNSFSLKLCKLQCNYEVENVKNFPNFFTDLRKLNKLRNKLAHKSFIEHFINDEKVIKIVDDNNSSLTLNLGKQLQVIPNKDFEIEIDAIFDEYSDLCGKYKNYFCLKLNEKLLCMKGDAE